jgi:hypothetical protein
MQDARAGSRTGFAAGAERLERSMHRTGHWSCSVSLS